jgi:hypothetical protein
VNGGMLQKVAERAIGRSRDRRKKRFKEGSRTCHVKHDHASRQHERILVKQDYEVSDGDRRLRPWNNKSRRILAEGSVLMQKLLTKM